MTVSCTPVGKENVEVEEDSLYLEEKEKEEMLERNDAQLLGDSCRKLGKAAVLIIGAVKGPGYRCQRAMGEVTRAKRGEKYTSAVVDVLGLCFLQASARER